MARNPIPPTTIRGGTRRQVDEARRTMDAIEAAKRRVEMATGVLAEVTPIRENLTRWINNGYFDDGDELDAMTLVIVRQNWIRLHGGELLIEVEGTRKPQRRRKTATNVPSEHPPSA